MNANWLQRGLLAVIVTLALAASVQNLLSTRELGSVRDDPVAAWEVRFAAVKQRLPFRRGVVGYISDANIPGAVYDPANDEGEYVLTQYVMAPIIIVKGTDQEWNIANLDRAAFEQWSQANADQFQVTTLKGGLYLLHRLGN